MEAIEKYNQSRDYLLYLQEERSRIITTTRNETKLAEKTHDWKEYKKQMNILNCITSAINDTEKKMNKLIEEMY